MSKQKVLFICTHNSARSQIAEGFLNKLFGDNYEGFSAGIKATKVNSLAVKVMNEVGIDISRHKSKNIEKFLDMDFDYVVTLCDKAKETCPYFPKGKKRLHKSFVDPAGFNGNDEEILKKFRQLRNEIKIWIIQTFGNFN